MRVQTSITVLTCWLGFSSVLPAEAQSEQSPVIEALRFFESVGHGNTGGSVLRTLRPPAVSAADRAEALAQIPQESVLQPDAMERKKLDALESVLAYHERDHVLATVVIDVPMATVKLHGRAFVLISRPTLRLLSAQELQATVAHEIGHEYFWGEYDPLRERQDIRGLQTLELKCDGVAALTLIALGLDPSHLYSAIDKIGRFNGVPPERWGSNGYPLPQDRARFIRTLVQVMSLHLSSGNLPRARQFSSFLNRNLPQQG